MNEKQKSTLENILAINGIIVFIWVVASWIDIIIQNVNPNPVYPFWNFFELIF